MPVETKICKKCKIEKSTASFYKDKHKKAGIASRCKKCDYESTKRYRKTKGGKVGRTRERLKRHYNLTLKQHQQMYVEQNGCCAVCNSAVQYDKVTVDHNHQTGKVRCLLCHRCNLGLAYIEDKEFAKNAMEYLKKHG